MNIVLNGTVGLTGTRTLAASEPALWDGFPERFRRHTEARFAVLELAAPLTAPAGAVSLAGGLYRALWRLGEQAGTGLTAEAERIPVEQAVIELCLKAGCDPFSLAGTGYVALREAAPQEGESLIGFTTPQAARILRQRENDRFLSAADEKDI